MVKLSTMILPGAFSQIKTCIFTLFGVGMLSISVNAHAYTPIQGAIPIGYQGHPANDLFYNGRVYQSAEIDGLYQRSSQKLDLSTLNPDPKSDLWKNEMPAHLKESDNDLGLRTDLPIQYVDEKGSGPDRYRVSVTQDQNGKTLSRTLLFSRTVHDVLLLQGVLRKIGYKVPAIQYLPKFELRFENAIAREAFTSQLHTQTFGSEDRWVVSKSDEHMSLIVQDAVALDFEDNIYNFALGAMTDDVAANRRLLTSLLVPFSLTNMSESPNLFPWQAGHVVAGNVSLPYDMRCSVSAGCSLNTNWEDARWIGRRIMNLTRRDWVEILKFSKFPAKVSELLVEKMIARRNSLVDLLELDGDDLEFDSEVTNLPELEDGEIKVEWFTAYATHYSTLDPESPLDASNTRAFFWSKLESIAIENSAAFSAKIPYLNQNINQKISDHSDQIQLDLLLNYIKTGEIQKVGAGAWVFPTWGANLIADRQIVAGSYLGTNNLVQVADTIGVSVNAGIYVGMDGLAPFQVSGGASASFERDYTHIKPIKSIKAGLKEPFKNILVPLINGKLSKDLEAIASSDFSKKKDTEQQTIIETVVKSLQAELDVGESLMITDALNFGPRAQVDAKVGAWFYTSDSIGANQAILGRTHFFRSDKNTIQVYHDYGNIRTLNISASLGLGFSVASSANDLAKLPILRVGYTRDSGSVRTKFSSISLDTDLKANPKLTESLLGLRQAVRGGSLERIQKANTPYLITHHFNQYDFNLNFLFLSSRRLKSATYIDISDPTGFKRRIFRNYLATSKGLNWENLGVTGVSTFLKWASDEDFTIDSTSGNPGYTFLGNAKNQITQFESVLDEKGQTTENFMKSSRVYNGWKASKKKVLKIIAEMNTRFGFNFYLPTDIQDTTEFILYNLHWDTYYYQGAFDEVTRASPQSVKSIFVKDGKDCIDDSLAGSMPYPAITCQMKGDDAVDNLKNYQKAQAKGDVLKMSNEFMKLVHVAEDHLTRKGFDQLFGGQKNYLISSTLEGFRKGSESGDAPISSSTLGEYGSASGLGPVRTVESQSGITDGEFLIGLVLKRAL